jgi:hypothetical protein
MMSVAPKRRTAHLQHALTMRARNGQAAVYAVFTVV